MKSLADQIYDLLRADIVKGELKPGTRIVELDIATEMGTSQGPVREALQRLEQEGLVERRARRATVVTSVSLDEMYELFAIRSMIEGFAIKRAAKSMNPEKNAQLRELIEEMRWAGQAGDMFALTEHDMRFHQAICQWSESAALPRAWHPLYSQIQRFIMEIHRDYFEGLDDIADTHQPIVEALSRGDAEEASRVIQTHIMLIWSRIEAKQELSEPI
jgi:DNA-binding GntR family transcriptional regulator